MFNVPAETSIQELLTDYGPKMVKESVENQGRTEELKSTEFTLVIDVDGEKYSFMVKNGTDVQVGTDKDLENAMVRYMISRDDLERMIASQQLDMLLGIITDLNQQKYQTLQGLKGVMTAILTNDDGSDYTIKASFNEANSPEATFKMKTSDSASLMRKESNPVNLFMSGAMKIEGDMSFAMATQPLFT